MQEISLSISDKSSDQVSNLNSTRSETMEISKKYLYVICIVIVVILFLAVLVGVTLIVTKKPHCESTPKQPVIDLSESKNIPDASFHTLANAAGYVYFFDRGFLELRLKAVIVPQSWKENAKQLLLQFECDTIIAIRLQLDKPKNISFSGFTLSGNNDEGYNLDCKMKDAYYSDSIDARYSCKKRMAYICVRNSTLGFFDAAVVVLEELEFEIDGDKSHITAGEFSKPPSQSLCAAHRVSN